MPHGLKKHMSRSVVRAGVRINSGGACSLRGRAAVEIASDTAGMSGLPGLSNRDVEQHDPRGSSWKKLRPQNRPPRDHQDCNDDSQTKY